MQISPFSDLINEDELPKGKRDEGYIELIEITGNTQELAKKYAEIVNEKLNTYLERPFMDSYAKRKYYYAVGSFALEKINDVYHALIYYEPRYRHSVSKVQETYDENTKDM